MLSMRALLLQLFDGSAHKYTYPHTVLLSHMTLNSAVSSSHNAQILIALGTQPDKSTSTANAEV